MKNKNMVIALLLVAFIGVVGLTLAYFMNNANVTNTFETSEFGTGVTQTFTSPTNWLPGDTTTANFTAVNNKETEVAVKITLTEQWEAANHTILSGWITSSGNPSSHTNNEATDEKAAIINFASLDNWIYYDGSYYYKYKLAENASTPSLINSVTFNSKVNASSNCVTTTNEGVITTTCSSTNAGYDGATYTLTATIETVQADQYLEHWNLSASDVNIVTAP